MDGAEHLRLARYCEGDICRGAGALRAEIELVSLADRRDVMGNVVVVEKCQRPARLDGDAVDREHPALLADRLHGDKAAGRQAEGNDEKERGNLSHGAFPGLTISAGKNRDDGWAGITG